MKAFKRPTPYRGITKGDVLPGDRPMSGKEYRHNGVAVVRKWPKVRGKAAVKAAKRARQIREGLRPAA